jgi:hypothetical protein
MQQLINLVYELVKLRASAFGTAGRSWNLQTPLRKDWAGDYLVFNFVE